MRRTAIALALLACAPARKPFGELAVSAVHQRLPQQAVVDTVVLRIESARIDYGEKLRVEANLVVAELPLPPGAAGDEVRRHPELLGAAFAIGLLPASSDPPRLWAYRVTAR